MTIPAKLRWSAIVLSVSALAACSQAVGNGPEGENAHEDHAGHQGQGGAVQLTTAQLEEFGIDLATAQPGTLQLVRTLPGEVVFNPDRLAHVVPRVPGVVSEVRVSVGDQVREGEVMAVLVSRELAKAKSQYLAALAQLELAEANFEREKALWEQKITPESEYLAAKQELETARVQKRLAERALHALGLSKGEVARLPEQPETALARYELTAPIRGSVTERHLAQGEVVPDQPDEPPFVVADLSNVWVQLTVYPKDLAAIQPGQRVVITTDESDLKASGEIEYVSPSVGEATRTATARVVLPNPEGRWRPGLFVTGRVRTEEIPADVVVPRAALQTMDGQTVVFVKTPEGFKPQPVEVGRTSRTRAAITSGLQPGDRYASANSFTLKAEMSKGSFGGHHH